MPDQNSSNDPRNQAAALLIRHSNSLYGYILACMRDRNDADDVLQNVAVVVVGSVNAPHGDADFLRWAREVARRRILEFQRAKNRTQVLDPVLLERLAEAAEWVEQQGTGPTRREVLLSCLQKLTPSARELLLHRYGEVSLNAIQLAERFGRSVQAVTSLLYRIRGQLRECVDRQLRVEGRF